MNDWTKFGLRRLPSMSARTRPGAYPPFLATLALLLTGAASAGGQEPGSRFRDCPVCPEMVVLPAGSFVMGSAEAEEGGNSTERPQRKVIFAKPFAVGRFEITFDEWEGCVRERGCSHKPVDSGWGRGKRPVSYVNWHDAREYAGWLAARTGKPYRLLSEAEWEYAARAGTQTAYSTGPVIAPNQANYQATGHRQSLPVGSFCPNAFGLHDMHGNVYEWVEDCANPGYAAAPNDGSAWTTGDCTRRLNRGGAWFSAASVLRSANRVMSQSTTRYNEFGFRVARALE